MPRNQDGTFTKVYNWTEEAANNRTFSGGKLEADIKDVSQGVEEALDRKGRGAMQAQIDMGNNLIVNLKNPEKLTDATTLQSILGLISNGYAMVDDGSIAGEALIKLKSKIADLTSLAQGDIITFIAPFSINPNIIKAKRRYELIEILGVQYKVLRGVYAEDSNYPDGIKDNRPSFIAGRRYKLELTKVGADLVFTTADGIESGFESSFHKNNFTPAGYLDLAYNYSGYANRGKFRFVGSYNPAINDSNGTKFAFGVSKIAMMSDLLDLLLKRVRGYRNEKDFDEMIIGGSKPNPVVPQSKDTSKLEIGKDLYPNHYTTRLLLKLGD